MAYGGSMNKAISLAFGAGLIVLLASSAAYASHSWGGYHWARTANPFTLKVGDNVTAAWDPYLDEAIADWNPSAVLDLQKVASDKTKSCRPTAGRIDVCNGKYGSNGWLGIAQIWVSGNHITQAITKLNDTYFNNAKYNTPALRRLVMCQEIAHDIGLDHQDEAFDNPNLGSCMDYTSNPVGPPSNEHPNAHDFEQIEFIYAHLDSITTIQQSTAPMLPSRQDVSSDDPRDWGRVVRTSKGGRVSLYEQDLGMGQKVFTFVTWANDDDVRVRVREAR